MKNALARFLFSRGVSKIQGSLSKIVRHGVSVLGGWTAANGAPLSDPDAQTLVGAGTILLGLGLAVAREFLAEKPAP